MSKIDTSKWSEYRIGDLFDIHPTKAYKLTNTSLFEENGKNPVIVNSSFNNGVGGYTNQKTTEMGKIITFSDTTTATAMFYQDNPFVGYAHIQGMYPIGMYKEKWNEKSLLFFLSVFRNRAINSNFDYANKFTRECAKDMIIKLPADQDGNPDFLYMETYMRNQEITVSNSLSDLQSIEHFVISKKNDTSEWKEFLLSEILDMQKQSEISPIQAYYDDREGIKYPFYGQSKMNNGIISYISLDEKYLNNKESLCSILIHSNTHECVLATTPFYLKDGHGATSIFSNEKLNELSALFIMSVLKNVMSEKFSYDKKATKEALKELKLLLPTDKNGNPDYQYMQKYMEFIMGKLQEKIKLLKDI